MVYESDFYTSRRPYTSSRPTITSYAVTRREVPWHKVPTVPRPSQVAPCFTVFGSRYLPDNGLKLPGLGKGQTYHRNIPHVAHKKLVVIGPSAHTLHHIKQSAYLAEIDRIYHKVRPSLAYQPTEDYLNSRSMVSFDDETRSIRAKTAEILKKIHTPIPRAQRPMTLPGEIRLLDDITRLRNEITILTLRLIIYPRDYDDGAYYSHSELPLTERISSDNYIDRLLSANREVQQNVLTMSHYDEPAKHYNSIGKGHLACVSFAGGRPISKRRNLASDDYIRDDINVLSHYGRFRAAANGVPHVPDTEYASIPHRPPTKSSVTGSWKSNAPHKMDKGEAGEKEPHIKANLTAGEEFDAALDTKKRRRDAIEAAALRETEEEKRRKQELERQDELAQQAALERQEELARKSRQEEEARRLKEEEEIIARENAERLAAEKKAQDEADKKAREEEERKAKEEAERLAKEEEEERKAQEEAERLAKEEEERKAREEAERKAKEDEERKAKEEEERLAKEEEERKAREEAERKAKEEAERLAKEEEERKAKEEAERLAKEEEERLAKEEEERLAKEEEERLANEAAEDAVEESGAEPVVEEPQSPEDAPNTEGPTAEEVEEEEEEEEEEE